MEEPMEKSRNSFKGCSSKACIHEKTYRKESFSAVLFFRRLLFKTLDYKSEHIRHPWANEFAKIRSEKFHFRLNQDTIVGSEAGGHFFVMNI